jgi:hypothetical protein
VLRHASLLAASVAVTGAGSLRAVLEDVYAALELDWDPATAGGVDDEVPGIGVDAVERAVLAAYGSEPHRALDAATLERARRLLPRHELSGA